MHGLTEGELMHMGIETNPFNTEMLMGQLGRLDGSA